MFILLKPHIIGTKPIAFIYNLLKKKRSKIENQIFFHSIPLAPGTPRCDVQQGRDAFAHAAARAEAINDSKVSRCSPLLTVAWLAWLN